MVSIQKNIILQKIYKNSNFEPFSLLEQNEFNAIKRGRQLSSHFCYCFETMFDRASPLNSSPLKSVLLRRKHM